MGCGEGRLRDLAHSSLTHSVHLGGSMEQSQVPRTLL